MASDKGYKYLKSTILKPMSQKEEKYIRIWAISKAAGLVEQLSKGANKGQPVNQTQGNGHPRAYWCRWGVLAVPTAQKSYWEKALAIIKRCQNTYCITACCTWGWKATDGLEYYTKPWPAQKASTEGIKESELNTVPEPVHPFMAIILQT